jgi:hypothetical protein
MDSTLKKSLSRGFALAALVSLMTVMSAVGAQAQWTTSGTNTTTTNNVGIGTNTPTSTLEVQGQEPTLTLSQAGILGKATIQTVAGAAGVDLHLNANARWTGGGWVRNDATLPAWNFFLAPVPGADFAGIRRAAPSAGAVAWVDIMRITNNGNVGIGTTTPGSTLTVNSDATVTPFLVTGNNSNVVGMAVSNAQAGSKAWAFQVAGASSLASVPNGSLIFRQATDNLNPVVISPAGRIGVGTATPATALHVVGDITVSGNINAKYQDVAEWVPSTQKLIAGTVVVLDTRNSNHVLASQTSYDARVAGVVSAQPGLTLGEAGEGKALVATTGRVKVKVDASRAPIQIGDLLVTSDVEGVAMKSEPINIGGRQMHSPGTIIGKALEPLEKGTGEILVLLSLQ